MKGPIKKLVVWKYIENTWKFSCSSIHGCSILLSAWTYQSKRSALRRARQIAKQLGCPVEVEE